MIRLAVMSDTHLETSWSAATPGSDRGDAPAALLPGLSHLLDDPPDVLLLAGDVSTAAPRADMPSRPTSVAVADAVARAVRCPVVLVLGNHEFYGHDMATARASAAAEAEATDGRVRLLDAGDAVLDVSGERLRLLGCTLWTDYRCLGEGRRAAEMTAARDRVNDHRRIRFAGRTWLPADATTRHAEELAWLRAGLARPHDGPTVVVTHHPPVRAASHPSYGDDLAGAFANALDDVVAASGAALWACGHSHAWATARIGGTLVVNRSVGYPDEAVPGAERPFRPARVRIEDGVATVEEAA